MALVLYTTLGQCSALLMRLIFLTFWPPAHSPLEANQIPL
jgi:hypothetical protein